MSRLSIDPDRIIDVQRLARRVMGRRWIQIQTNPSSTARSSVPQNVAQTPAGTLANADGADGPWVSSTTAASSGSAGDFSDSGIYRRDWGVWGRWKIKTGSDITNIRIKCGFISGASSNTDSGGTLHQAEMVYSTPTPFGGWRALTNDGSGSTAASSGDLLPIAASTVYEIDVRLQASSILFGINGKWLYEATSKLPTSTQLLFGRCQVITQTAGARVLLYSRSTYLYET